MFIFQETIWQLFRNVSRTLLLLLASALLAGCMAFYLGNIRMNEESLNQLARSTDVRVSVTNASGETTSGLNIDPKRCDAFQNNPYLRDFRLDAVAKGAYSETERMNEQFMGGDADIVGLNCLQATWMPDGKFIYADGYDESFLLTDRALCLVDETFAEENGIDIGDEVTLPVFFRQYSQGLSVDYTPMGEQTLTVIGFSSSKVYPLTFIVPVQWLRVAAESQGLPFTYSGCSGYMKDPRQINEFKSGIEEMSFLPPNPEAQDQWSGIAIVVDDEQYINTAEELGRNIVVFRKFLIPFFALVIGTVILAIFLVMRGSQKDIAIACSLGRSKILSAFASFLASFVSETVGCLLIFPIMILGAKLSCAGAGLICGAFLLCACVGNVIGLALILRFDMITLLTMAE